MLTHLIHIISLIGFLFINQAAKADEVCRSALRHPHKQTIQNGRWWDTWTIYDPLKREYHSYSQWISDSEYTPDNFAYHNKAKIRHRVSKDQKRWIDLGIIQIENDQLSANQLAFWSGSVVIKEGLFYLFYTRGANEFSSASGEQRIHMAVSEDGHQFKFQDEVLTPERMENSTFPYTFEFTLSKDYRLIPALRDPHVFKSDRDWVMLFATNVKSDNGEVRHAIGSMHSSDLRQWHIDAPLDLPVPNYTSDLQIELPNLAFITDPQTHNKTALLMVSTRRGTQKMLHFFTGPTLSGPWSAIPLISSLNLSPYYGFNFVKMPDGKLGLTFFNEKNLQLYQKPVFVEFDGHNVYIK